jgi:hypothetical protein
MGARIPHLHAQLRQQNRFHCHLPIKRGRPEGAEALFAGITPIPCSRGSLTIKDGRQSSTSESANIGKRGDNKQPLDNLKGVLTTFLLRKGVPLVSYTKQMGDRMHKLLEFGRTDGKRRNLGAVLQKMN